MRASFSLLGAVAIVFGCSGPQDSGASQSADSQIQPESQNAVALEVVETYADTFIPDAGQFGVKDFKVDYELEGQLNGTKTIWVEDYGARVAVEQDATGFRDLRDFRRSYWDGEKVHLQSELDGDVSSIGIRPIETEPSSVTQTPPEQLEMVGYSNQGQKQIAGVACQVWQNDTINFRGCYWNKIEMESVMTDGDGKILQRITAISFSEDQRIPSELSDLATQE